MTANVFREDVEHCIEAGMNDHIGKPVDMLTLFAKLNKFLECGEISKANTPAVLEHGISWNDSYELGNAMVDAQHRKLFGLVNDLIKKCEDGSSTEKVRETLDFLVDYAVQHFFDEETLQLENNYPGYEMHKKMHENFKLNVGMFVEQYNENGSSEELNNEVNNFLVRWLINHIQKEDKKIGEYIKSITASG